MFFREWRRRRLLARSDTSASAWAGVWGRLPLLAPLSEDEATRLRELATLFLHEKSLEGAAGLILTPLMRRAIALQASLPLLNLGPDWFDGWVSVIVYPDEFVVDHEEVDEAGVVHRIHEARTGEAWERGPLVLAWSDVEAGVEPDGYNVILHEMAHKLDGLNGGADGLPPLHRGMSLAAWSEAFTAAWDAHNGELDAGREPFLDPYAAESPAEFFAVATEAFFELPQGLRESYPAVYGQLTQFYRQDPANRGPLSLSNRE